MPNRPIGIFDSGIGGLTVANAIKKAMPNERLIYLGDTAHLPYGDKSADAIRYFSIRISKFLLEHDCKMIVIACHSASSAAYDVLMDFYDQKVLFVNVVDELVSTVIDNNYNKVGVIATKATIRSNVYETKIKEQNTSVECANLATPLLVPMIEEGFHQGKVSHDIIAHYLSDKRLSGIEAILLACTHFPLIKTHVAEYFDHKVDVLDSTDIIAKEVYRRLEEKKLLNTEGQGKDAFYVTDFTQSFADTTKLFYNDLVNLKEASLW